MGDNRTAFLMGDSAHLNPPIWPPSFYSKLSPKPIVKNNSSRNFARIPSYSTIPNPWAAWPELGFRFGTALPP